MTQVQNEKVIVSDRDLKAWVVTGSKNERRRIEFFGAQDVPTSLENLNRGQEVTGKAGGCVAWRVCVCPASHGACREKALAKARFAQFRGREVRKVEPMMGIFMDIGASKERFAAACRWGAWWASRCKGSSTLWSSRLCSVLAHL